MTAARRQVEHYFSPDNLCRDTYLRSKMDDNGFVFVSVVYSFNMLQRVAGHDLGDHGQHAGVGDGNDFMATPGYQHLYGDSDGDLTGDGGHGHDHHALLQTRGEPLTLADVVFALAESEVLQLGRVTAGPNQKPLALNTPELIAAAAMVRVRDQGGGEHLKFCGSGTGASPLPKSRCVPYT